MQLDAHTSLFFSASVMITISFMMICYAVSRRENRKFIWLSIASGFLGLAYTLTYLRGQIPDFFSIIISNELVLFCLIAVYEVFRKFLAVDSKVKAAGYALLVLQFFLLIWFTYFIPDFRTRILIINMSTGIMAVCIIKLMLWNPSKAHRAFHFFAALPFVILFVTCLIRIMLYLLKSPVLESSFASTSYGISLLVYCILLVWISFSIIFITANALQNTLADIALSDSLTGVLNRRGLKEAVDREISRSRRAGSSSSIILNDFDHFKKINDAFGHQAGDAVLIHTIHLFRGLVRAEDLLARYGGEEFVIVLPGVDAANACLVADRLRRVCKETPLLYKNQSIPVTSSFGVTEIKNGLPDYDTLIKQADNALYRAKANGRDQVVLFNTDPGGPGSPSGQPG